MRLPAAGPGSMERLHEFAATAARRRGRYGRALSCGTDAMACMPVSSRVDSAVPRQPRRPTATAPHGGLATALVWRARRALCCDDRGASEGTKRGTVKHV